MMDLASKAIEVALSYVGVTEHPPGSNRGPEVDRFLRTVKLDPTKGKYAWCAAFVATCVHEAAAQLGVAYQFSPSAGALRQVNLNPDLLLEGPEPNSVFVIDHGSGKGHTGFVRALDLKNPNIFHSIEGNSDTAGSRTGGSVVVNTRRVDQCAAFIRIA